MPTANEQQYDVVITDGRIIAPETGLDDIRNVGIKHGSIIAVANQETIIGDRNNRDQKL